MTTRDKILNRAARLFHEKGFSATTVREIASNVGIEAASLYNHIDSKHQLLEQICFTTADLFSSKISEVESQELSPLDKVKSVIDYHLELGFSDPKILMTFSEEWRHLSDKSRRRFQTEQKKYEKALQSMIEDGQRDGSFVSDLDATISVKFILSSMQWVYFIRRKPSAEQIDQTKDNLETLIIGALTNKC